MGDGHGGGKCAATGCGEVAIERVRTAWELDVDGNFAWACAEHALLLRQRSGATLLLEVLRLQSEADGANADYLAAVELLRRGEVNRDEAVRRLRDALAVLDRLSVVFHKLAADTEDFKDPDAGQVAAQLDEMATRADESLGRALELLHNLEQDEPEQ